MNQIEQLLARKLEAAPDEWSLRLELARSLFNRGETEAAADVVGQAPTLPPEGAQLLESARLLAGTRPRTAEIMLQTLLESEPGNAEAAGLLAEVQGEAPSPLAAVDPVTEPVAEPGLEPEPEIWHEAEVRRAAHTASATADSAIVALKPLPLQPPPRMPQNRETAQAVMPTAFVPENASALAPQPPPDARAIQLEAMERTGLVTARPFARQHFRPAAEKKAVAQREKLSAAVVAVVVHAILIVVLGLIALNLPAQDPPELTVYAAVDSPEPVLDKKEITTMSRKTSSASAAKVKVMSANLASPVAVPVEELTVETFEPMGMGEIGVGLGFGGAEFGEGQARAGGSAFGFTSGQKGDLIGSFYDVKQDARGNPRENPNVVEEVRRVIDAKFSAEALGQYFKASKKLFATHLIVPVVLAEEAPRIYGVENRVDPGHWFIHYKGKISPHRTGSYRLVGKGDDVLVVLVNGKVVLDGSIAGQNPTDFQTTEPDRHHPSPQWDGELVYGDWFPMTKGKNYDIDIVFGEAPGGHLSGFLLAERRGGKYEIASDGRPVLPPFAVAPISDKEWKRIGEAEKGGADPKLAYSPFDFARELELMKPASEMEGP